MPGRQVGFAARIERRAQEATIRAAKWSPGNGLPAGGHRTSRHRGVENELPIRVVQLDHPVPSDVDGLVERPHPPRLEGRGEETDEASLAVVQRTPDRNRQALERRAGRRGADDEIRAALVLQPLVR